MHCVIVRAGDMFCVVHPCYGVLCFILLFRCGVVRAPLQTPVVGNFFINLFILGPLLVHVVPSLFWF